MTVAAITSFPPTINRIADPFNNAAPARLIRMGILNNDKEINRENLKVISTLFAGLFFDELYDWYDDCDAIFSIYSMFSELHEREDYHHLYLYLSVCYDQIGKTLPEPVWWIAGQEQIIILFMEFFFQYFSSLMNKSNHQKTKMKEG